MIMTQDSEDIELEYYKNILDFFQNEKFDSVSTEIWKNKTYIKLMKVLERTQNKEFVRNAILMLLSLFEEKPPDLYNNIGLNANCLNHEDKKSFKMILKSEFLNDFVN